MRDFVDERNQESIFVERSVDGNQVQSVGQSAVIPMSCNAMIHNFQMHPMGFDQFKNKEPPQALEDIFEGSISIIRQLKTGIRQLVT